MKKKTQNNKKRKPVRKQRKRLITYKPAKIQKPNFVNNVRVIQPLFIHPNITAISRHPANAGGFNNEPPDSPSQVLPDSPTEGQFTLSRSYIDAPFSNSQSTISNFQREQDRRRAAERDALSRDYMSPF